MRGHLRWLAGAGVSLRRCAAAAGASAEVVRDVATGRSETVDRGLARALLALTLSGLGTPTGARRRLQGLVAMGWSVAQIARRAGWDPANVQGLLAGRREAGPRAIAEICALYDALWGGDPLRAAGGTPESVQWSQERAAHAHWASPLAWDDDSLDDPAAVAAEPRPADQPLEDLLADIGEMADQGADLDEAARRAGYDVARSLERRLT
ncbi:MAG: hypothetical protein LBH76_10210, partial [Propionibacteriaceae bacterium]|nr:hypothetical protein [Propionibacteriaceae bacterium]